METFCNLHSIAFDNSDSMSFAAKKEKFFFGREDSIQIMWDYCILSKMEVEKSAEELDEGDHMHLDILPFGQNFSRNMVLYQLHKKMKLWIFSNISLEEI